MLWGYSTRVTISIVHTNVRTKLQSCSAHRFLESMVTRLSSQLSELQRVAQVKMPPVTTAADDLQQPAPPWLVDADTVNPLLLAYDGKVERLEAEVAEKRDAMARYQRKVECSAAEVDALHAQLTEAMEVVAERVRRHSASHQSGSKQLAVYRP
jgi:DNA repair exonuclease SbcCD ATPase subunit